MNDAQKMLFDFCEQQGFLATEIYDDAEVWTIGIDRQIRKYSLNIYGDVIDLQRGVVIAESNMSHNEIEHFDRPVIWKLVDGQTSLRKKMDTKNRLNRATGSHW